MSSRQVTGLRAWLLRRLGFDYELMGQGFGEYYAWNAWYHIGQWTIHVERSVGGRWEVEHPHTREKP